ncbi:hypothetical protein [Actinomyces qiguomingii]|uniref:hypothetical protein n=1 Tax=Actinomyces qiguomingii TaxID=2057800 RepID=UPI000CA0496C|nr:hypothetical protein [Actinomyces qiguomingii]
MDRPSPRLGRSKHVWRGNWDAAHQHSRGLTDAAAGVTDALGRRWRTRANPPDDLSLKVTGIYQDITNNGLTAKALIDDAAPALWRTIYADIDDSYAISAVVADLRAALPEVQVMGMNEYASHLFGATATQVRIVAAMACTIAALPV